MGLFFAVVSVFVTVGAAAYYVGMGVVRSQAGQRVVALRETREELFQAGFDERVVGPAFRGLGRFVMRLTPIGWGNRVEAKLRLAAPDVAAVFCGFLAGFAASAFFVGACLGFVDATGLDAAVPKTSRTMVVPVRKWR